MSARSTRPKARPNASEEIRESDAEAAIGKIDRRVAGGRAEQSEGRAGQRRAQRSERQYAGEVRGRGDDLDDRRGRAAVVSRRPCELSRAIEQRLHSDILESLPLGVCLASESGVILYANPAAESSFGYKPGELVARNVEALHESSEGGSDSRVAEILEQMFGHEIWSGELSLRTKDGEIVRTDSWISSLRVGGKDCRLLVQRAVGSGSAQEHSHAAAGVFRGVREGAPGTASLPGARDPNGPAPTRPPDSEPIGARGRSK